MEELNNDIIESSSTEITELEKQEKKYEITTEVMSMGKLMEMSTFLAKATNIPVSYQNRPENCFVALDMANRMQVSPTMVMQNLYVIQGKPSWAGQAVSAMIRTSPQFKNVELHFVGTEGKDDWGAYITATRVSNGKTLKGGTVTIGTAKREGWYQKSGSKWQTMPEIMLSYRAYTWFGRVYAPELMMGLQSREEIEDVTDTYEKQKPTNPYERSNN